MAADVTLATLRTRIRQRTDNEHSQFVTDSELTDLVNTEYQELYAKLVTHGLQRVESTQTITANGATAYTLSSDFYSLIGIYRHEGDVRIRLERFSERFRPGTIAGPASHYRLVGHDIVFYPNPPSGTYTVVYIPESGTLSADDDTVDGCLGWEELIVISCAIKVLQKEEADVTELKADKQAMLRRIEDERAAMEFTESWAVQDRHAGAPDRYLEGDYVGRRGLRTWRY